MPLIVLVGAFNGALLFPQHFNGIADIVGILFHNVHKAPFVEEFIVPLLALVFFHHEDHLGADILLIARLQCIAVRARRFPLPGLVFAKRAAAHRNTACHHKRGIKAHAELADHIHLAAGFVFPFKIQTAAFGNGAKVFFQLVPRHADAVVAHRQRARILVQRKPNEKIFFFGGYGIVCEAAEIELVNGIARIADKLAQKDLFVRINGMDHHIQQTFGFCSELFF